MHGDLSGATEEELDTLDAWAIKLMCKYPTVGLVHAKSPVKLADIPERPHAAPGSNGCTPHTSHIIAHRGVRLDADGGEAALTHEVQLSTAAAMEVGEEEEDDWRLVQ